MFELKDQEYFKEKTTELLDDAKLYFDSVGIDISRYEVAGVNYASKSVSYFKIEGDFIISVVFQIQPPSKPAPNQEIPFGAPCHIMRVDKL